MPAIDSCEPQVIRALAKAGWQVVNSPVTIRLGDKGGFAFADLLLQHETDQRQAIIVEVKCFPTTRSPLDEMYHAIGQYLVYRSALRLSGLNLPLYLSLPHHVLDMLDERPAVLNALQDATIETVVVDLSREVIVSWSS